MKFTIVYGSVRENRQGIRAAKYVIEQLKKTDIETKFVDAKDYNLPLLDKRYFEYEGNAPKMLEELHNIFDSSDAIILVSGEYNHGLPPALKNILDHFQPEFHYKPSGLVTYSTGIFGGVRAAVHLRAVTAELGMPSVPTTFPIPSVSKNIDTDGKTDNENIQKGYDKFIKELIWYAEALKSKKEKDGTPK